MPARRSQSYIEVEKAKEKAERRKKAFDLIFPFLAASLFLVLLILFLEIIFQASKVSYFSQLSLYQRIAIPLILFFIISIPVIILWMALYVLSSILYDNKIFYKIVFFVSSLLLSLVFFIVAFSHLDTFIYTIAEWSVYDASKLYNIIILFLLIDISVIVAVKKGQGVVDFILRQRKPICAVLIVALIISFLLTVQKVFHSWREAANLENNLILNENIGNRPNIILFGADALDRRRLGIYGYIRNTTPNMDALENAVIYTRSYTNCGNSRGSIISMLTGKSPLTTKLFFPPDILHDENAYQHLPNILAKLGYYNVDLNDGFYASTAKSNLKDGFHSENGKRTAFTAGLTFRKRINVLFSDETYFLADLIERHWNKIAYMIGRSPRLLNYARFMVWGESSNLSDRERIDILTKALRETEQPVFAHVHLLATHGPNFNPPYRKFSAGKGEPLTDEETATIAEQRRTYYSERGVVDKYHISEEKHWDLNDDAIVSVDHFFGDVIQTLKETGKFENTIIIFLTDHGHGYFTPRTDRLRNPLPLVVWMPGQKKGMSVDTPVQYLDIAPSLLSYLNQPVPKWMEGDVIFGSAMDEIQVPERAIVSVYRSRTLDEILLGRQKYLFSNRGIGPPHYGIGLIGLITDRTYYMYAVKSNSADLYDVSSDPFDFQAMDNPPLLQKNHTLLRERLLAHGVEIEPTPSIGFQFDEHDVGT